MCILSAYMLPGASFIKIENVEQAQQISILTL